MKILSIFFLLSVSLIYYTVSWGVVVYNFYNWFLLPVFTTLPIITFSSALGLGLFLDLFRSSNKRIKEKHTIYLTVLNPWILLTIGYILKLII